MITKRLMRSVRHLISLLCFVVLLFPFLSQIASAESIYKVIQTPFYDPNSGDVTDSCSLSTAAIGSSNLPSDIITLIAQNKSTYQQAAQATNVPWQLLAAIHYRETNLSLNASDGGPNGQYQITTQHYTFTGTLTEAQFLQESIDAGNFIQQTTVRGNLPNHRTPLQQTGVDPEEIKDTLFSYNGRATAYADQAQKLGFNPQTQPYEGSPYVMNNYDTIHQNMGIITGVHGGNTIDGVDTRFGAFVIYAGLGAGNSSSSPGGCSGAVVGNAVATAINYAWPYYHSPNYCQEKSTYKAAIEKAAASGQYIGGICTIGGDWVGVDCGAFITRVMIDSGTDPGYNYGGDPSAGSGNTIQQQAYLDQQVAAGKYIKLTNVQSTNDLQPGDIAINTVHTYMYVGSQPGFNGNSASASFSTSGTSWRAPMASEAYGIDGEFTWYRLKSG